MEGKSFVSKAQRPFCPRFPPFTRERKLEAEKRSELTAKTQRRRADPPSARRPIFGPPTHPSARRPTLRPTDPPFAPQRKKRSKRETAFAWRSASPNRINRLKGKCGNKIISFGVPRLIPSFSPHFEGETQTDSDTTAMTAMTVVTATK